MSSLSLFNDDHQMSIDDIIITVASFFCFFFFVIVIIVVVIFLSQSLLLPCRCCCFHCYHHCCHCHFFVTIISLLLLAHESPNGFVVTSSTVGDVSQTQRVLLKKKPNSHSLIISLLKIMNHSTPACLLAFSQHFV